MGCIQSFVCAATYCTERVLTWGCCAFMLVFMMCSMVMVMVYGISVGYHYAQRELSVFTLRTRLRTSTTTEEAPKLVVRLLAVNRSEAEQPPHPLIETRRGAITAADNLFMDNTPTAVVYLETERPRQIPVLSSEDRKLAQRLIGRFRRSQNNATTTVIPFLRPLRNFSSTVISASI